MFLSSSKWVMRDSSVSPDPELKLGVNERWLISSRSWSAESSSETVETVSDASVVSPGPKLKLGVNERNSPY